MIWLWMLCAVCMGFTPKETIELLNGQGKAALSTAGTTMSIDLVFAPHPGCDNGCFGDAPCALIQELEHVNVCYPMKLIKHERLNTSFWSCPSGTVCCTPELCQRPEQLECRYEMANVELELERKLYYSPSIHQLIATRSTPTSLDQQQLHATLADTPAFQEAQCNAPCNHWINATCPTSCACVHKPSPKFHAGIEFPCSQKVDYHAKRYTRYARPRISETGDKPICPAGFYCQDHDQCISHNQFNRAENATISTSTRVPGGVIALLVIGGVLMLGIAISAFWYRKHASDATDLEEKLLVEPTAPAAMY